MCATLVASSRGFALAGRGSGMNAARARAPMLSLASALLYMYMCAAVYVCSVDGAAIEDKAGRAGRHRVLRDASGAAGYAFDMNTFEILSVNDWSQVYKAGLRVGMVLTHVEDQDFSPVPIVAGTQYSSLAGGRPEFYIHVRRAGLPQLRPGVKSTELTAGGMIVETMETPGERKERETKMMNHALTRSEGMAKSISSEQAGLFAELQKVRDMLDGVGDEQGFDYAMESLETVVEKSAELDQKKAVFNAELEQEKLALRDMLGGLGFDDDEHDEL